MIVFLLIVGCVVLSGAIVGAPLLLPWPAQVRWLMSARSMGADGLIADGFGGLQMEETRVVAVDPRPHCLVVVVADPRRAGHGYANRLVGPRPGIGQLAALEGWAASATPLLLITEPDGQLGLHGPRAAYTGLRRAEVDRTAAPAT